MKKFSYERNEKGVQLEASGDLIEIAAEVGHMVRHIYAAVKNRDPEDAELFKVAVKIAIAAPGSPTWDASACKQGVAIVTCTDK